MHHIAWRAVVGWVFIALTDLGGLFQEGQTDAFQPSRPSSLLKNVIATTGEFCYFSGVLEASSGSEPGA